MVGEWGGAGVFFKGFKGIKEIKGIKGFSGWRTRTSAFPGGRFWGRSFVGVESELIRS